jgi:hypothetical protein
MGSVSEDYGDIVERLLRFWKEQHKERHEEYKGSSRMIKNNGNKLGIVNNKLIDYYVKEKGRGISKGRRWERKEYAKGTHKEDCRLCYSTESSSVQKTG